MKIKLALGVLLLATLSGCANLGPDRLVQNRFNYNSAIGDSWKEQMLLNIVKMRYGDVPVFLAVQSVIDQYNFTAGGNFGGSWTDSLLTNPYGANIGGNASYSITPTVTYAPMAGDRFAKLLMTPIPEKAVIALLQTGYSPEMVLRLTLHSICGRQNHFGLDPDSSDVDPGFYRIIELISALQSSNSLGLRVDKADAPGDPDKIYLTLRQSPDADNNAKITELRALLNLDPKAFEYLVVYGAIQTDNKQIALLTRSVIDVLADLSGNIDVPAQHLTENRASPALAAVSAGGKNIKPLLTIHTGDAKPDDALVAVPYNDYWYWISQRDLASKTSFSFMLFIFNLNNTVDDTPSPMIVLPAAGK
jgi:hypothetical protein